MERIYWNAELETKPWAEVEAWQAERIAGFVSRLPARSEFYRSHLGAVVAGAAGMRSFEALDAFPFTGKDQLRQAQFQTETDSPFGANQAVSLFEIVQAVSYPEIEECLETSSLGCNRARLVQSCLGRVWAGGTKNGHGGNRA